MALMTRDMFEQRHASDEISFDRLRITRLSTREFTIEFNQRNMTPARDLGMCLGYFCALDRQYADSETYL